MTAPLALIQINTGREALEERNWKGLPVSF
jgi:hypothetical protein